MTTTTTRPIYTAADPGRAARNRHLGELARGGDGDARRMLIEENRGLAGRLAGRYAARWRRPLPDVLSDAFLGLVESANDYDPARSAFTTHAHRVISFRLMEEDRTIRRARGRASVAGPVVSLDAAGYQQEAPGPGPRELAERGDARTLLAFLTPDARRIISLRFGLDGDGRRTVREVAQLMDLCHVTVRRRELAAMAELRAIALRDTG